MLNYRHREQVSALGCAHTHTHTHTHLSPAVTISTSVVFIRRVTCFVQATDQDNRMVVEVFGVIIQVLASEVN